MIIFREYLVSQILTATKQHICCNCHPYTLWMSCDIYFIEVKWLIFSSLLLCQVSKSWKVLAEDEVLWRRLCLDEGFHNGASISDSPCWKSTLRDCRNTENGVKSNWKVSIMPLRSQNSCYIMNLEL